MKKVLSIVRPYGGVFLGYLAGIAVLFVFMRMEMPKYISMLQLFTLIFILDAVGFCCWRPWVRARRNTWTRYLLYAVHFLPGLLLLAFFIGLTRQNVSLWPPFWRTYGLGSVVALLLPHLVMAVMYIVWAIVAGIGRLCKADGFAAQWWRIRHGAAMGVAGLSFIVMLYGMVFGAFDLQVLRVDLRQDGTMVEAGTLSAAGTAPAAARIPAGLAGYRIAQISDFHIGSFVGSRFVERVVRETMALQPDLIVFTGDIVNFGSAELLPHAAALSALQAPDGVYAILGNHDYGDYVGWDSPEAKAANLQLLKDTYAGMGWRLLDNRSLWITRGGDSLRLVGVENWGGGHRFPKYGDLDAALAETACAMDTAASRRRFRDTASCGTPAGVVTSFDRPADSFCRADYPQVYTVLLSHDPSHFDSVVEPCYPQIDLCLSGHTHGMQLGVRIGGKDFTGAHRMYKHDAGLYTFADGRRLYVNTGVGFNGAPFRVGIRPRIVLLEL